MEFFQFNEVFRDKVADGVKTINTDHSYIHGGIAFKSYIEVTPFAEAEYLIHTPADKYIHLKNIAVSCVGGSARISLKRGTETNPLVIDSAGDTNIVELIPPANSNDASGKVSGVVITKAPTYITGQKGEDWIVVRVNGTATNQSISIGSFQQTENEENVLKPDTDYVLKLLKVGADTATNFSLMMFWYEEGEGQY